MKTQKEVRNAFWQYAAEFAPEFLQEYKKTKRQNQYSTDIRCAFVDFVDVLMKDGEITEKLANNVTL